MIRTLALVAALGALLVALLAFPVGAMVAGPTVTAWELSPHDPDLIELNQALFEGVYPDHDVTTADASDTALRDDVIDRQQ